MIGTIKTVKDTFGFIRPAAGQPASGVDLFFHSSDVEGALDFDHLTPGDAVEFEVLTPAPERGPRATKVRWLEVPR